MALKSKFLPSYTYADYLHWKGRWEIIEGTAYAMSPSPSFKHQKMANHLGRVIEVAIESGTKCSDCIVLQPIDIKISENTVVNPDLTVICGIEDGQTLEVPPQLVVEILSPSTRLKDLHTKYELYQDFGIKYYLIVDLENQSLMLNESNTEGKYQLIDLDSEITLHDSCRIQLNLQTIWN